MRAFETSAVVEDVSHLRLDRPVPPMGVQRVKVIVLFPDFDIEDEAAWLAAQAKNNAFDDLADPAEDIYSPSDGREFVDAG